MPSPPGEPRPGPQRPAAHRQAPRPASGFPVPPQGPWAPPRVFWPCPLGPAGAFPSDSPAGFLPALPLFFLQAPHPVPRPPPSSVLHHGGGSLAPRVSPQPCPRIPVPPGAHHSPLISKCPSPALFLWSSQLYLLLLGSPKAGRGWLGPRRGYSLPRGGDAEDAAYLSCPFPRHPPRPPGPGLGPGLPAEAGTVGPCCRLRGDLRKKDGVGP